MLLYVEGCPNWQVTEKRLGEAQRSLELDVRVQRRKVETPEQAEQIGFHGSPTLLIDGTDPFDERRTPVGLTCRVYQTPEGLKGSPTVDQLVDALG